MVKAGISVTVFLLVIATAPELLVHSYGASLVWMFLPSLAKVSRILREAHKCSVSVRITPIHFIQDNRYLFAFTKVSFCEFLSAETQDVLH